MKKIINEAFDFNSNIHTNSLSYTDKVYDDLEIQEAIHPDFEEVFSELNLNLILLELCNWYYQMYFTHAVYLKDDNSSLDDFNNYTWFKNILPPIIKALFDSTGVFKFNFFPKNLYNEMDNIMDNLLKKNVPLIFDNLNIAYKYFNKDVKDLHAEFSAYMNKLKGVNEVFDFNNVENLKDVSDNIYNDLSILEIKHPDFKNIFKELKLTPILLELCDWYYLLYMNQILGFYPDATYEFCINSLGHEYNKGCLENTVYTKFYTTPIFKLEILTKQLYDEIAERISPIIWENLKQIFIIDNVELFAYFKQNPIGLSRKFQEYANALQKLDTIVNEAFDFNNVENSDNIGDQIYDDIEAEKIMHPDFTETITKLKLDSNQAGLCDWYYQIYMNNIFHYSSGIDTIQTNMNNDYIVALFDTTTYNMFTLAGVFKDKILKKALYNKMARTIRPLIKDNLNKIISLNNTERLVQYFKLDKSDIQNKFHTYVYELSKLNPVTESFDFNNIENDNSIGMQSGEQLDLMYPKFDGWIKPNYPALDYPLQLCYDASVAYIVESFMADDDYEISKKEIPNFPKCAQKVLKDLITEMYNATQMFIYMYTGHFFTIAKRQSLQYKLRDLLYDNVPKIFEQHLENHWAGKYHTLKEEYKEYCRKQPKCVYESFDFNNVENNLDDMYNSIFGLATPEDISNADYVWAPFNDDIMDLRYRDTMVAVITLFKESETACTYLLDVIAGNFQAIDNENSRVYYEKYIPKHPWYAKWWGETFKPDILIPMWNYVVKFGVDGSNKLYNKCIETMGAFLRLNYYEKALKEKK